MVFYACLSLTEVAEQSAFSFLGMPTWLGTQQKMISIGSNEAAITLFCSSRTSARAFVVRLSDVSAHNELKEFV